MVDALLDWQRKTEAIDALEGVASTSLPAHIGITEALNLARETANNSLEIFLLIKKLYLFTKSPDFEEEALRLEFGSLINRAKEIDDVLLLAHARYHKGRILQQRLECFSEALACIIKAECEFSSAKRPDLSISARAFVPIILRRLGKPMEGLHFSKHTCKLSKELDNFHIKGVAASNFATYRVFMFEFEGVLKGLRYALECAVKAKSDLLYAKVANELGMLLSMKGMLGSSIRHYSEAMEIYRSQNIEFLHGMMRVNIANSYMFYNGQTEKAIEYLNEAQEVWKGSEPGFITSQVQMCYALAFDMLHLHNRRDEALAASVKAMGDRSYVPFLQLVIIWAYLYLRKGSTKKAASLLPQIQNRVTSSPSPLMFNLVACLEVVLKLRGVDDFEFISNANDPSQHVAIIDRAFEDAVQHEFVCFRYIIRMAAMELSRKPGNEEIHARWLTQIEDIGNYCKTRDNQYLLQNFNHQFEFFDSIL